MGVLRRRLCFALFALCACAQPNLLFIIVDDLNDLPLHPAGKPLVPTPHIDRLADRGVSFTNAHCNDPICAPSRSSMLFGLYPQTSGLYWFEDWRQNPILKSSTSLPRHMRDNGYGVYGTGKIFHGGQIDPAFTERGPGGNVGPWPWDGDPKAKWGFQPHPAQQYLLDENPDVPYQWEQHFGPLSMIPTYADRKGWTLGGKPWRYVNDEDRDRMPDESCVAWSKKVIGRTHTEPFALITGLVRTHTPLYAPKKYFDRFPLGSITLPRISENDLADCAAELANRELYGFRRYQMLKASERPQLYKQWLQAYMACVSFIDDQVGELLEALDASPHRENTVVIFTSDHGFHMGEKEFLYKQSLWDGGTRVPLIVAGPGIAKAAESAKPVSLIDLYPTINALCKLPASPHKNGYSLDGHSLLPILRSPQTAQWSGPSVAITALPGKDHMQHKDHAGSWYPHFSVRAEDWRYSLTASGAEELYHYPSDPHEWKNLADNPEHRARKAQLRAQLIALRDGDRWQEIPTFANSANSEILGEFRNPQGLDGLPGARDWTPIRVRRMGKRQQIWVDHRVYSDTQGKTAALPKVFWRELRKRQLLLP